MSTSNIERKTRILITMSTINEIRTALRTAQKPGEAAALARSNAEALTQTLVKRLAAGEADTGNPLWNAVITAYKDASDACEVAALNLQELLWCMQQNTCEQLMVVTTELLADTSGSSSVKETIYLTRIPQDFNAGAEIEKIKTGSDKFDLYLDKTIATRRGNKRPIAIWPDGRLTIGDPAVHGNCALDIRQLNQRLLSDNDPLERIEGSPYLRLEIWIGERQIKDWARQRSVDHVVALPQMEQEIFRYEKSHSKFQ